MKQVASPAQAELCVRGGRMEAMIGSAEVECPNSPSSPKQKKKRHKENKKKKERKEKFAGWSKSLFPLHFKLLVSC